MNKQEKPEFYVGTYDRKVDDKGRITLPSHFCIPESSTVYFKRIFSGVICYDYKAFAEKAAGSSSLRFKDFKYGHVDDSGRLSVNGRFKSGMEVVVQGNGKSFLILEGRTLFSRAIGSIFHR